MADVPGALVLLPRAPQLVFAANPGSIMEWLLFDSANDEDADIAGQVEAISNRMCLLPAVADAAYTTETTKLKDEEIGLDDLSCFLTITMLDTSPPFVLAVLGLCRYSGGLGFQEVVGDQLPHMVQVGPDVAHLDELLLPANLETTKTSLMSASANVAQSSLARLAYFPKAWVPYFLDRKAPWDAYDTMKMLMEGLNSDAQERVQAEPLLEWVAATCVHLGGNGMDRCPSDLNSA
eukprot:scaffold229945_cov61-Attheya_sp.AAC.1